MTGHCRTVRAGWFGLLCLCAVLVSVVKADAGRHEMPHVRGYANHVYVTATPTNDAQLRELWSGRAIVVEPHDPALVPHKLALTATELRALQRQGIAFTVLHPSFQAVVDAAYESWVHPPASGYSGPVPEWFARVQSLTAIFDYMDELAQQSQGRATVKVIGRAHNEEMRAIRISSSPQDGERATILVTGTQHADEWLSPMVVTGLVWGLIANYDSDVDIKKIVDNLNVYIIPVMNPDSYGRGELARRTNQNPRCTGGVNLNRNWPSVGWGRGVQPCGGDNFAGDQALSEPETKAAKALADSLSQLVWYVDYHTPREAVMIPYAWTSMKPKMYDAAKEAAQSYASILGVRAQDGIVIGQGQGGGSLDYFQEALDDSGGISLCIEMTGSIDMRAPSTGIPDQVDRNLRGLLSVAAKLAEAHPDPSGAAGAAGMGAAGAGGMQAAGTVAGASGMVAAMSGGGGGPSPTGVAGSAAAGPSSGTAGVTSAQPSAAMGAMNTAGVTANANAAVAQPSPVAGIGAPAARVIPTAGTAANPQTIAPAHTAEQSSSGCEVAGSAASGGSSALVALALLLWRTRRRSERSVS